MALNVNMAIDTDTGTKIVIKRTPEGSYVDGLWVKGEETLLRALASIQQPTKQEIELVTGLERNKELKTFYVNKKLIASNEFDKTEADIIKWDGREYKAMHVGEWEVYGYNIAVGARIS